MLFEGHTYVAPRQTNKIRQADKNLDFFLGHLSNTHGEGGEVWEGATFILCANTIVDLNMQQRIAITTSALERRSNSKRIILQHELKWKPYTVLEPMQVDSASVNVDV